jgi:hypothetical protein
MLECICPLFLGPLDVLALDVSIVFFLVHVHYYIITSDGLCFDYCVEPIFSLNIFLLTWFH